MFDRDMKAFLPITIKNLYRHSSSVSSIFIKTAKVILVIFDKTLSDFEELFFPSTKKVVCSQDVGSRFLKLRKC